MADYLSKHLFGMTKIKLVILLFISIGFSFATVAQNNDTIIRDAGQFRWERFSVDLGTFLASMSSDIQLGNKNLGLGLNINLEDALGLETSVFTFRGDAGYTFGKKQRSSVRLGYFGLFRSAFKDLESELQIGDKTFPIGTTVSSKFHFMVFRGIYDYAFYKDERVRFCISGGFYVMPIKFTMDAFNSESAIFTAPLPVVGISNSIFITPKLMLHQNIDILYFEFGNFRGNLSDISILLDYKPFKHFGGGLGFNTFKFNLKVQEDDFILGDFVGELKSGFSGLMVFGSYFF
jgi:hypothetical protein